jgi:predicted PurR-regulated permease PerM
MVVSNTIGIPLIAFLQGVVGLIGYLIIGINEPFLWFAATCITAMMPVVGAALVYVPLTVMLFAKGETGRGIAMAIWGFGFIGLVDNLFRFIINKKIGDIHPLITIFGVLAGLQLFGFIGIIFGPLLISMFILLLRIYGNEFLTKRREMHRVK